MVKFSDLKELEKWLSKKPDDWRESIATRSVERALLAIRDILILSKTKNNLKTKLLINILRAMLLIQVSKKGNELKNQIDDVAIAIKYSVELVNNSKAYSFYSNKAYQNFSNSNFNFLKKSHIAAIINSHSAIIAARSNYTLESALETTRITRALFAAYSSDCNYLEGGISPSELLFISLWRGENGNPLELNWHEIKDWLYGLSPNWQFWIDWYQAKLDGTLHPGLNQSQQDNLYYQIATFPNEIWEDGAEAVNQRIAELLSSIKNDAFDFFLSYSASDEEIAKKVSQIIQQKGYSVFAQFNDMPVGSNFITEMQEGLENSSRFICLYSENYWTSDYCQQEWNAAITYDPRGKERKIVPFLISECAIPPLARPLVYKNLIGLNDEEFQKAVLEAIENNGVITSEQARKVAKETISPEPYFNDDQELDIRANEAYDQQRVTEDLLDMPDLQSNIIEILLAHCEKSNSVPSAVKNSLNKYLAELTKNNIQARVTILDDAVDFIEIRMEEEDAEFWLDRTIEKGLSKLLSNHSKIKSHFPLDPIRQENYKEAPIDPHILDDKEFLRKDDQMKFVTKDLEKEGKVTSEFLEYLKQQNERLIEILSLNPSLISKSPEDAVLKSKKELDIDDLKKRHLLQKSGFVDKLSETLNKPDKIVASPSLNLLAKIAKELGDWIWK